LPFLIPVTILHTTKERLIENLTTEKIEIERNRKCRGKLNEVRSE
jgi:hypothetical protein